MFPSLIELIGLKKTSNPPLLSYTNRQRIWETKAKINGAT